jgi:hypothetical protein
LAGTEENAKTRDFIRKKDEDITGKMALRMSKKSQRKSLFPYEFRVVIEFTVSSDT